MELFLRGFRKHGDIVRFQRGRGAFYLVSHPRYVKHFLADNAANYPRDVRQGKALLVEDAGLFGLTGESWKRRRRLMQPGFHRERMLALVPAMVACTQRLLEHRWGPRVRSGEPFDLMNELSRVVVSQVAQAVYSEDASDEAFAATRSAIDLHNNPRTLLVELLFRMLPSLCPRRREVRARMRALDEVVRHQLEARRAAGERGGDLLGAMMEARDEKGEGLSDAELRAEFFTLFHRGHEATTSALTWVWYELGRHPEIAGRVSHEVERVLGNRPPTVEDLPRLRYLTMIFEETMRLYPPASALTRQALEADRMGGYDVPAGTVVSAVPYVIHRHPELWEEPERFDPERFAPGNAPKIPRYGYVPFGAGQRLCMGNNLALMQATITLAMVVQRYRLSVVPGRPVVPARGATYYPKGGLWVTAAPARPGAA